MGILSGNVDNGLFEPFLLLLAAFRRRTSRFCPVSAAVAMLCPVMSLTATGLTATGLADEARTFEGFTEPVESIQVSAKEPGPIAEVLVRRGDQVQQKQLLVRLDDLILKQARAVLEAEAAGTAELEALAIERNIRERRYRSLVRLHEAGSGSDEEVALAGADFEVAAKKVDAGKEQQQIAVLKIRELDARLAQRQVESPIDGVVVEVKKKRGEFVATEDLHLVTIVQLKMLRAVFFLPTVVALQLQSADHAAVTLPLHGIRVPASVEYVAPVTEPDSGLVRVHLLIANDGKKYRSGIRCLLSLNDRVPATPEPLVQPAPGPPVRLLVPQSAFPAKTPARNPERNSAGWVATARSRTLVRRPAAESDAAQE